MEENTKTTLEEVEELIRTVRALGDRFPSVITMSGDSLSPEKVLRALNPLRLLMGKV